MRMDWLQRAWGAWEYQEATAPSCTGTGGGTSTSSRQRSGMVSQEKLEQFYDRGYNLFDSTDFVQFLRETHRAGRDIEDIVSRRQAAIFEELGVEGAFGVSCLARVKAEYGHDPSTMRKFYLFAQREELLMDEVELPEEQVQQKRALFKQQEALAARLQHMSVSERQQLLMQQQQMMQHLHEMSEAERHEFLQESKLAASAIMQEMGGLSRPV